MKKPRYAGDARMRKLLERYACPTPFHVVRAMMMGNIASPLMASPMKLIQSLWNDKLPEFETEQEAEAFFGELLGLWNHLGRHQSRSQPFKLVASRTPADRDDLEDYCQTRFEELAALLDGFFQREDKIDLPPELADCIEALEDTAEMFGSAKVTLADDRFQANDEEFVQLQKKLGEVLKIANRESAQLVWLATDYRRARLPGIS